MLSEMAQRTQVVENPESPSMRARDEIGAQAGAVVFHLNVAD